MTKFLCGVKLNCVYGRDIYGIVIVERVSLVTSTDEFKCDISSLVFFIRMSGCGHVHGGRGGRRGKARRGVHEVPVHRVLVQEEGFGQANMAEQASQANVAEQVGQAGQTAMGALAREMAGALREAMNLLRAENQARENIVEARASFHTRELL